MYFHYKKAEKLARCWVELSSDEQCELDLEETITKSYGWDFFYQGKKFLENKRFEDMLVGNALILIDRIDGGLFVLGTAQSVEQYLLDHEKTIPKTLMLIKPEYPAK